MARTIARHLQERVLAALDHTRVVGLVGPRVTETLAGRIVRFELWPLSQGELTGVRERFVDAVFGGGSTGEPEALSKRESLRRASTSRWALTARSSRDSCTASCCGN